MSRGKRLKRKRLTCEVCACGEGHSEIVVIETGPFLRVPLCPCCAALLSLGETEALEERAAASLRARTMMDSEEARSRALEIVAAIVLDLELDTADMEDEGC